MCFWFPDNLGLSSFWPALRRALMIRVRRNKSITKVHFLRGNRKEFLSKCKVVQALLPGEESLKAIPALFMRMSQPPRSRTNKVRASIDFSSDTSSWWYIGLWPLCSSSATAACPSSTFREVSTMEARSPNSSHNRSTQANPIPLFAPVTMARQPTVLSSASTCIYRSCRIRAIGEFVEGDRADRRRGRS